MSRLRFLGTAWVVLAVPFGVLGAQTPTSPLDTTARPIALEEAVALAQRNSPQAIQARGQERIGRASLTAARAAFLPELSVNLGGSWQKGQTLVNGQPVSRSNSDPWTFNDALNVSLTLFQGGERLYGLRSARAELDVADAAMLRERYAVALDVNRQYFAVIASREREAAALSQLEQAQAQLAAASARVRAGAATRSDSLRSVVLVGNARLAVLTARNDLRVANATLTRLVATPFTVTAAPVDSLASAPAAGDSLSIAAMLDDAPAVRAAEAQAAAARAAARAARAPFLPTVSASFGRSGFGNEATYGFSDPYGYSSSFRFSVSYPLFNGWQREASLVRANVAEDNADATLRDARLQAEQDFVQAVGQLRTAQEQISIQSVSVAAAEEDLRVVQQRYSLGASTLLDVLTSQTQLNQARSDLIQARFDYRVARAQLEALLGRDLP